MSQRRYIEAKAGLPVREVIRQCLYDTKVIPQGGVNSLSFFTTPTAGFLFSNMVGQGAMPKPQEFYTLGMAVELFPGITVGIDNGVTDTWASFKKKILETAYVEFWVGAKRYLLSPLKRVPQGVGPAGIGVGGEDANAIVMTNGLQDINHFWETAVRNMGKKKPVKITSQQAFSVMITWPTAAQANPGFGTGYDALIRVYLVGYKWREVQ